MADEATSDGRLWLHRDSVRPEWIDYNGHLNVAYYGLIFDHASDAFFDLVGVTEPFRRAHHCTWVVLETHNTFRDELMLGEKVRIASQILGYDDKRLHLFHAMYRELSDALTATTEIMTINMDSRARRATLWHPTLLANIEKLFREQRHLPPPPQAGRSFVQLKNRVG